MGEIFLTKKVRLIMIIFAIIFGLISYCLIGEKMSSPEAFKTSMETLDEKKVNVVEMTAITTATSVAIAAVPGDSTTPVADKLMDLSGYLFMITILILCEKYFLTLSGMLVFKILIPIAMVSIIIYLFFGYDKYKRITIKIIALAIALLLAVPGGVRISRIIEETYKTTSEYSIEKAKKEQEEIKEKAKKNDEETKFYKKFANKVSTGVELALSKAESMINQCIDFIAVMLITNLLIPVGIFFLILHMLKMFTGFDYTGRAVLEAQKMNSLLHKKKNQSKALEKIDVENK